MLLRPGFRLCSSSLSPQDFFGTNNCLCQCKTCLRFASPFYSSSSHPTASPNLLLQALSDEIRLEMMDLSQPLDLSPLRLVSVDHLKHWKMGLIEQSALRALDTFDVQQRVLSFDRHAAVFVNPSTSDDSMWWPAVVWRHPYSMFTL